VAINKFILIIKLWQGYCKIGSKLIAIKFKVWTTYRV